MKERNYKVYILQSADDDISELTRYYLGQGLEASKVTQIVKELLAQALSLDYMPQRCSVCTDKVLRRKGYRKMIYQDYIIFFTIDKKNVYIHRILRSRRNWKDLLT